jgi:hypothetical protein
MVLVTTKTRYNTDRSESRIPDFEKATILLKTPHKLTNLGHATIQCGQSRAIHGEGPVSIQRQSMLDLW